MQVALGMTSEQCGLVPEMQTLDSKLGNNI